MRWRLFLFVFVYIKLKLLLKNQILEAIICIGNKTHKATVSKAKAPRKQPSELSLWASHRHHFRLATCRHSRQLCLPWRKTRTQETSLSPLPAARYRERQRCNIITRAGFKQLKMPYMKDGPKIKRGKNISGKQWKWLPLMIDIKKIIPFPSWKFPRKTEKSGK